MPGISRWHRPQGNSACRFLSFIGRRKRPRSPEVRVIGHTKLRSRGAMGPPILSQSPQDTGGAVLIRGSKSQVVVRANVEAAAYAASRLEQPTGREIIWSSSCPLETLSCMRFSDRRPCGRRTRKAAHSMQPALLRFDNTAQSPQVCCSIFYSLLHPAV